MNRHTLTILVLLLTLNNSYAQETKLDTQTKEPSQKTPIFYGKILEIKTAKEYKYLKIDEKGKEIWIAIADAPVSIGQKIGFDKNIPMKDFFSKTLNQKFEMIYFSSDLYLLKPFSKKEKYTVEEIFLWRKDLKDQTVTVKGTVSKNSRGIMDRDWVHLKDGSGDESKGTNDLVFTADNTSIKVGDTLEATGKVTLDKDFGFGYFYPVIIENATFKGH